MLSAFYAEQIEGLLTYFTRQVGWDAASDLASQVFAAFVAWWPENSSHPEPVAALYCIAKRRLADYLRRHGRVLPLDMNALEQALGDGVLDDGYTVAGLRTDLKQALAELPERSRAALALRYVVQLSVPECAEVLKLGTDNTKKILKNALAALRTSPYMTSYGPGTGTGEVQ
ncbi:RNA polymerase sigma factor [Streptomyces asoensis]|uniref:RNA polymerase sigma factor n=1 Tax=Streptomyces asoensis TaxID=249586 RepID=UPI0036A9567C